MMPDMPLPVRVAEVLGHTGFEVILLDAGKPVNVWMMDCPCDVEHCKEMVPVPCYDKNWTATGPLIEEYQLLVSPYLLGGKVIWAAETWKPEHGDLEAQGPTPLIAICNLLLKLPKGSL